MRVSRTRHPLRCALFTAGLVALAPILVAKNAAANELDPAAATAISSLEAATGGQLDYSISTATGNVDFVRAENGATLALDNATASPADRALSFLNTNGTIFGIAAGTSHSQFDVAEVTEDNIGMTHVRLNQRHEGLEVFAGQLIVHMNDRGITGVNGSYVTNIAAGNTPQVTEDQAADIALSAVKVSTDGVVQDSELLVYPVGLLEGNFEAGRLAWAVRVSGENFEKRVFVDALTGAKLGQISERHESLHRIVYSPDYDPNNPDANVRREEGDPPAIAPPAIDRLYDFAGQVYELFDNGFDRDSYDGLGAIMRSVYLVNDVCPNAYWNSTSTNYCPGFDTDDIVAHEWGHAYTEKTHGLIYSFQSGALNESYSDIFGEIVDLNNDMDNPVGANPLVGTEGDPNNNDDPYPDGQRWIIGEDLVVADQAQNDILTRDMWDPDRLGSPGKVTSSNYACGPSDGGGVHTNSGVPNHAFAMLVDGQTYNGQTVNGIGFNRATHIYYRAMTVYQGPASNFAHHAESLLASCNDLSASGVELNDLFTGQPSNETVRASDCDEVAKAMVAVEMKTPPTQCGYEPMLDPNTPPLCEGADLFYSDDFESGLGGWTLESNGVNQEWPDFNWVTVDNLPEDRAGFAAFAEDSRGGTCAPGGDISGAFSMDSAVITIPAGSVSSQVRFDHFVETELEYDGGNLMVSVNGGDFVVLTEDQFEFNAPKSNLSSTADGNTNPKAGELAWHGANGGEVTGSWGTTIVDLTELAGPGDTVQLRYDFGVDGCNGVTGWFVDNVNAYTCTDDGTVKPPAAPQQQPIADDAEPDQEGGVDQDGNYTVSWTYPDDAQLACGFRVEEATAFGNLFQDDANEALAAGANSTFSGDVEWRTAVHPTTGSNSYSPVYHDLSGATLTQIASVTLPAGQVAVLSFDSFEHIEEGFDQGIVSVSADGGALELVDIYTGEFSGRREVSLGAYAGQAVKIAFTLNSDFAFSAPLYEGWYIDNIEINSADWTTVGEVSGSVRSFDITERQDGTYHYRVIGMFGDCSGSPEDGPISNERSIVVERGVVLTLPPTASFTVTPSMAEVGEVVTFDGSGSYDNDSVGAEPQITSYFWSFGDGMTMTTSDPVTSHTYLAEGTYQVRLRVTDNDGQIDSADDFIVVDEVDDNSDSDSEKVKGSGYILIGEPADNDDDSDSDSDSDRKAKFSFNTKLKKGELKGSLKYEDKLNAVKVKADSISNRWVTGSDVTFTAPCEVNKVDGYSCTVYASDLDESGGVDTFAIHISEIDYQAGGELAKGDIKIY